LRGFYRGFAEQATQQAPAAGGFIGGRSVGTQRLINGIELGDGLLLNGVRLELSGIYGVLIKDKG
jgi:hypothetical protein